MLGANHGLVALDIYIHLGIHRLRNFADAFCPAAVLFGSHARVAGVFAAGVEDFLGIRRDNHLIEQRRRTHCLIHPHDERTPVDLAQHFSRQAR